MQTVIKGRIYSFPYGEEEPLENTIMRNVIALTTMRQDEYDLLCDHEINNEEQAVLSKMIEKGILEIDADNHYRVTELGSDLVERIVEMLIQK